MAFEQAPTRLYRLPDSGRMVDYVTYRELTGKCETCGAPINAHPDCDACGILCGTGHFDGLPSSYREHNLCGHCIVNWKHLNRALRRRATWDEFLSGKMIGKGRDRDHA